jgi:hypothetical protein
VKKRDLELLLKSHGWWLLREGGHHEIWTNGEETEPVPRRREISGSCSHRKYQKKPKHFRDGGNKTMRFEGCVWKDKSSKYWLVEVPLLDVMTQGISKKDAYTMIADAIKGLVNRKGFEVDVRPLNKEFFTVGASIESVLVALMLKRQREFHRLTLLEVAQRLGQKSPNAYARYEQGKSLPTVEQLNKLLKAIDPGCEPILKIA